jgi:hypothetical protein
MKKVLIWIWCFPQMLLGLLVKIFTKAKKQKHGNHYRYNFRGGSISLGEYIFLCPSHWNDEETLKHEYGHTRQSLYLGWLYLIVIGLPSVIWANCFENYRKTHNKSYYWFYTEKWANKLGGVDK